MRWMRELSWRQWLLVVPAVAVLFFGIHYTVQNWSNSRKVASVTEEVKPNSKTKSKRDVASKKKEVDSAETYSADDTNLHEQIQGAIEKIGEEKGVPVETSSTQASSSNAETAPAAPAGGGCANAEFRGDGPTLTNVSQDEWAIVMDQFHSVKKGLSGWLVKNKSKFSAKTYALMDKQIQDVKLQRPPAPDEPDLAWRGVAVMGKDLEGEPMIRMGNGFLKLMVRQPERGRFELARVVAQAWAPCEVQKAEGGAPWAPLLKCLGVDEANGCAAGTYSEAGWAVSTVLAYKVANPGCAIPALADANAAACVNTIPFATTAATAQSAHSAHSAKTATGWKEASR